MVFANDTEYKDPIEMMDLIHRSGANVYVATPSRILQYLEIEAMQETMYGFKMYIHAGEPFSARPTFENPSFDPGITGSYADPREQFRTGESASWSNGEVHRSRRQMKDSIHKQKKQTLLIRILRLMLVIWHISFTPQVQQDFQKE